MKSLLVLTVCLAAVVAEPPSSYGAPPSSYSSYGAPPPQAPPSSEYGGPSHVPQTFRHVYVHSAPDEAVDSQSRVIRVPGGDKHVNIIFVKTPSSSSSQQTEVILPEQDQHKNLVYVLLKKGENTANIKVRRPPAQAPRKPEVFFIRYKNEGSSGYGGSPSSPPQAPPSSQYGF